MEKDKHLGLRIDSDTHRKLKSMSIFKKETPLLESLFLLHVYIMCLK